MWRRYDATPAGHSFLTPAFLHFGSLVTYLSSPSLHLRFAGPRALPRANRVERGDERARRVSDSSASVASPLTPSVVRFLRSSSFHSRRAGPLPFPRPFGPRGPAAALGVVREMWGVTGGSLRSRSYVTLLVHRSSTRLFPPPAPYAPPLATRFLRFLPLVHFAHFPAPCSRSPRAHSPSVPHAVRHSSLTLGVCQLLASLRRYVGPFARCPAPRSCRALSVLRHLLPPSFTRPRPPAGGRRLRRAR